SPRTSPRSRCLSARKCGRYSSACSHESSNMDVGSLIEKALRDGDPIKTLRSLAVELSSKGHPKTKIYELFLAKYLDLQNQGRETAEHMLGDVMDMITDTYPSHNLHLPDNDAR